jgi:hypothetical protein
MSADQVINDITDALTLINAAAVRGNGKRREEPAGICVGLWKHEDSTMRAANAVYIGRDKLGRTNRRISKLDLAGNEPLDTGYDYKRTSYTHKDILYFGKWAGESKADVDAMIRHELDGEEVVKEEEKVAKAMAKVKKAGVSIDGKIKRKSEDVNVTTKKEEDEK